MLLHTLVLGEREVPTRVLPARNPRQYAHVRISRGDGCPEQIRAATISGSHGHLRIMNWDGCARSMIASCVLSVDGWNAKEASRKLGDFQTFLPSAE